MHTYNYIYISLKKKLFGGFFLEEFCRFHKFLDYPMTSISVYFLSISNKSKETDVALILQESSM